MGRLNAAAEDRGYYTKHYRRAKGAEECYFPAGAGFFAGSCGLSS
jgi:hypothetical protein